MSVRHRRAGLLLGVALSALLALGGCASGPNAKPQDPLEPLNRGIYRFNDSVDRTVLKPVATAYRDYTPGPLRTGINNFFGNLRDVWSGFNALLQARPAEAGEDFARVGVNTVLGLGGVLDVASEMGFERTTLDFGLTLGRWGVPDGPYLVLPILGPSTLRDTVALKADFAADPVGNVDHVASRNELRVLRAVDQRAGLLRAGELIEEAALDPYGFMRDSYLQRRHSQMGRPDAEERFDLE